MGDDDGGDVDGAGSKFIQADDGAEGIFDDVLEDVLEGVDQSLATGDIFEGGGQIPKTPSDIELGSDIGGSDVDQFDIPGGEGGDELFDGIVDGLDAIDAAVEAASLQDSGDAAPAVADPQASDVPESSVNKFVDFFDASLAQVQGDRGRKVRADGALEKRAGRTHPNTRPPTGFLRLALLKRPPPQQLAQGKSSYAAAVALLRATAERWIAKEVRQIWATLQSTRLTPSGTKYMLLSKSGDETTFPIRFSRDDSAPWLRWQLDRVFGESISEADKAFLAAELRSRNVGFVHLLGQHVTLRWAPGSTQASFREIPVPPCAVQNTSWTNYNRATEQLPFEEVSFAHFRDRVLPFLDFGIIHLRTDEGPGCAAWQRRVYEFFNEIDNAAVLGFFCKGHVLGNSVGEGLKFDGVLKFFTRFAALSRTHDYYTKWLARQVQQGRLRCGLNIMPISDGDFKEELAASDEKWDRLFQMTALRESVTQACEHPHQPKGAISTEELESIRQLNSELKDLLKELKILVNFNRLDFRRAAHMCSRERCGPIRCDESRWLRRFGVAWSRLLEIVLPQRTQVTQTRFLSWSRVYAIIVLSTWVLTVGPEAWLEEWPTARTQKDLNDNNAALLKDDSDGAHYAVQSATRLHGVSSSWSQLIHQAITTTTNPIIIPFDRFYRFADRSDSKANQGKGYPPLLLSFLQPTSDRNPMKLCFEEVANLFLPGSDLSWSMNMWHRAVDSRMFYFKVAFRTVRLCMRILGKILLKIGLPCLHEMPMPLLAVISAMYFHGDASPQALNAANSLDLLFACDIDVPFSAKVMGTPRKRGMELLTSVRMQAVRALVPDCTIVNMDEERLLALCRLVCFGDNPMSLQNISNNVYTRQVTNFHERGGGVTAAGHTTSTQIKEANLDFLQRRTKRKHYAGRGQMNAWTLFFKDHIAKSWHASQKSVCKTELRISAASKDGKKRTAKQKKTHRETAQKDGSGTVFMKGSGEWHTWFSHLRAMSRKWDADEGLQRAYALKAVQWNDANGGVDVDLAPAKPTLSNSETFWKMGCFDSPVRVELLAQECELRKGVTLDFHPSAGRDAGPISTGRKIMKETAGKTFIGDVPAGTPSVPLDQLKSHRPCCWSQFPGLCQTRDAPVFKSTLKLCHNLNQMCAKVCRGRTEWNMVGRVLRLDYLLAPSAAAEGTGFFHRHVDVYVCHVRLLQPQVQIFAPMVQRSEGVWTFMMKGKEIYANTSYCQIKTNMWQMRRSEWRIHNVFLHELFICPHPPSRGSADLWEFRRVSAEDLDIVPLAKGFKPIPVFPDLLTEELQVQSGVRKGQGDDDDHAADGAAKDPIDAAFDAQAKMEKSQSSAVVAKYMQELRRALFGLDPSKRRVGPKRAKSKGGGKGGKSGAAAPAVPAAPAAAPGPAGAPAAPAAPSDPAAPAAAPGPGGVEGDSADSDGSDDAPMGPMPWALDLWREEPEGKPVSVEAVGASMSAGELQRPLFPRPPHGPASPAEANANPEAASAILTPESAQQGDGGDGAVHVEPAPIDEGGAGAAGVQSVDRRVGSFGPHVIFMQAPKGAPNSMAYSVSIICGRHLDSVHHRTSYPDGRPKPLVPCRRNLVIKQDETGDDCMDLMLKLKHWVCLGYELDCPCPEMDPALAGDECIPAGPNCTARSAHMKINPRGLSGKCDASLIAKLPLGPGQFEASELECLRC